jgi:DNA-binding XRE family transcriptional regulator
MTKHEFYLWRDSMGLTQKDSAELLGISYRTVQDYEAGRYRIPIPVQLAMSAIFHKLSPWRPQ